jgi:hypothetical protein
MCLLLLLLRWLMLLLLMLLLLVCHIAPAAGALPMPLELAT